jgi:4-amino-4-deoxy-L-arabinose transferase-like glycosyltransferase
MNRSCNAILVPVLVFLICFFLFTARHRFIDGDEGFYLLGSQLVMEHKAPYLDFFFTQAPLLPYAYGLWMKLFGISWFSARSFSATLTAVLGLLIYEHVCYETKKWIVGVAAVILFASSTLIFSWFPIVKTYSLTAVFLFGSYVILTRLSPASSPWLVAVPGLLFGLSVDTRSYLVGLLPILIWWIFRCAETHNGISRILWFLVGFTIGTIPCLYLFFSSPDRFLFDNLGYHAIRSNSGLIGQWKNKIHIYLEVLFGAGDNGWQFTVLSALSFITILVSRLRVSASLLAFLIAFVIGIISILPTPPFVQYFCLCMPFLIVAAVCGISDCITSLRVARQRRWIAVLAGVAVLAFAASSGPSFRRYLITGNSVIGIEDTQDAPNWTLDKVSAVSNAIDQLAASKEEIASFWPGYIFSSKAVPYPGFENDFGWTITDKLTVDQRLMYHISSPTEIAGHFVSHIPRIAVLGNQSNGGAGRVSQWARILRANGYTAVRAIGDTYIFVCCSRQ